MADIRINALATTAASTASDDFVAVDGSANGTRKLNAYSPTFGGNLTVSGTSALGDATGGVFYQASLNSNNQGTGVRLLNNNAGSRNWYIGSQNNVGNAVEITPSTANNGTTFSTPVWQISSAGNVTQTGNLTVSGTGNNSFTGPITNPGASWSYFTSGTNYYSINAANAVYNPTSSTWSVTTSATPSWRYDLIGHASSTSNGVEWLYRAGSAAANSWTAFMRLAGSGNLLLGTTTDSSNGKLQLADHTTSAGGIGFGTDTSLYRVGTGILYLSDGTNAMQFASDAGGAYVSSIGSRSLILRSNSTTALTLDSSQNATFAGKITANGAGSTFKGTATNDSAAAGYVGEFVSSIVASGSAVSLTTNTITNVTSISLTAGDWDVFGAVDFIPEAATVRTRSIGAVSTTSASLPATYYRNTLTLGTTDANAETYGGPTPVQRISISSTTTVYLVAFATFSGGTQTAHGYIQARRVR